LRNIFLLCIIGVMVASCSITPVKPSEQHIQQSATAQESSTSIPQPIKEGVILPPPKPAEKVATYSVVVTNVPAQEILFAVARDAKINLDIQAGIQGTVTLNAINQTLPQILDRISKQVDMRYELDNGTLSVMPDTPYLHNYKIDYVNIDRDMQGGISSTSQIGTGVSGTTAPSQSSGSAANNNSLLAIKNSSKNHFWETLVQNIKDILRETDKIYPSAAEPAPNHGGFVGLGGTVSQPASAEGKAGGKTEGAPIGATTLEGTAAAARGSMYREAASVIAIPEAGIITVRATSKQHEKIQQFIDQVMKRAQRQVLIEATVVEVTLNNNYQQGIDWSKFLANGTSKGFNISQTGTPLPTGVGTLLLNYTNPTSKFGAISASIALLETFGKTKVLSSPQLSVLNNQTAMLRVVDNDVWFNVNSTTAQCAPSPCTPITTYTTTVNTVQVGLTMSVTPEINDSDSVLLNIRPSITRRLADATDPTPNLAVPNLVPQLSTREMESVLKIQSNQIAVLGGLMEDSVDKQTEGIPVLAEIPLIGNLFKSRNDATSKTELVIFLRPIILNDASNNAGLSQFHDSLPDKNFFEDASSNHL
jgi:MSHA biogenesis protein MshL